MSTDTHIHAIGSFDSSDPLPFKVASMAVEGLELPVSTEHDFIGDFNPTIANLGLGAWIQGVVGTEVTTFTYGHFNTFPLVADPSAIGNGRIEWYRKRPAELFATVRARQGDPYLQVNHPRSVWTSGYFETMGLDPATFTAKAADQFSLDFDAIEVANGCWLDQIQQVTADWFSFLNHGQRRWASGGSDSHTAGRGEMGYPKTYVKMPTDDPATAKVEDLRRAMKAGHMSVSCGPFVELSLGSGGSGDLVPVRGGTITLSARVSAPSWMDVRRVFVVVNGGAQKPIALSTPRSGTNLFDGTLTATVPPGKDGWVLIVASGDRPNDVFGQGVTPYAFTNPILLDGNGDGAWTPQP
jgi:hypothetical protein